MGVKLPLVIKLRRFYQFNYHLFNFKYQLLLAIPYTVVCNYFLVFYQRQAFISHHLLSQYIKLTTFQNNCLLHKVIIHTSIKSGWCAMKDIDQTPKVYVSYRLPTSSSCTIEIISLACHFLASSSNFSFNILPIYLFQTAV